MKSEIITISAPAGLTFNTLDFIRTSSSLLVRPTSKAQFGCHRFDQYLNGLEKTLVGMSGPQRFLSCLLAFEGVLDLTTMTAMAVASRNAKRQNDRIEISWTTEQGQVGRRVLSSRTCIALAGTHSDTNWHHEIEAFTPVLARHYPQAQAWRRIDIWSHVFDDAAAWLYLYTPHITLLFSAQRMDFRLLSEQILERERGSREGNQSIESTQNTAIDDSGPAHDVSLDMLLSNDAPTLSKAALIPNIRDIFSLDNSKSDVRLEDHQWRKRLYPKLAAVAELLALHGTVVDAVLLSWVHFLLTSGSLRLTNPAVTTVARYFSSISDPLAQLLSNQMAAPINMTQEEWSSFFDKLCEDNIAPGQGAAISSFHHFCICTFGIDPIPTVLYRREGKVTTAAKFVWPHEISLILKASLTVSMDERVNGAVHAMLALAAAMPLRIGELHSLRRGDLTFFDGVLEVHIDPKRGNHQGKSAAARRVMRTTDGKLIEIIKRWDERRNMEGDDKESLLWGDPHRRSHTYKFGLCTRLLNRLLVEVTGDSDVSFHTMRHAWVTQNMLVAFQPTADSASISRVQELSVQAGHNNELTTLLHYFHRPEVVLRETIDHRLSSIDMTAAAVSYWTGQKQEALRKAKQRSPCKRVFYAGVLQSYSLSLFPEAAPSALPIQESNVISPPMPFGTVRKVLSDMQGGFSVNSILSRCSISEDQLHVICMASAQQVRHLDRTSKHRQIPSLMQQAKLEHAIQWVRAGLDFHGVRCDLQTEPLFKKMDDRLMRLNAPSSLYRHGASSWRNIKRGSGLDMTNVDLARPLLSMFQALEVPGEALVLRVQSSDLESKHGALLALASESVVNTQIEIEMMFSSPVRIEAVRPRDDRPAVYLLISRALTHGAGPTQSASLRMNRIHGLMFVLSTWTELHDSILESR